MIQTDFPIHSMFWRVLLYHKPELCLLRCVVSFSLWLSIHMRRGDTSKQVVDSSFRFNKMSCDLKKVLFQIDALLQFSPLWSRPFFKSSPNTDKNSCVWRCKFKHSQRSHHFPTVLEKLSKSTQNEQIATRSLQMTLRYTICLPVSTCTEI